MRKAQNWNDLPAVTLLHDTMTRTGYRTDGAIVTFNRIAPSMRRWKPHSHPFDQVVLIVEGHLILEVDGIGYEMGPRSIARVPANVMHSGWPVRGAPVLNIDVFAPVRSDYLFLTRHQTDFAQPEALTQTFNQEPSRDEFKGEIVADAKGLVYAWDDLPTEDVLDGQMTRSAFRGDDSLVVFNRLKSTMTRPAPHSHPFDQLVMVVEGNMALEFDGEVIDCGPGSVVRIPSNVPHTKWPLSNKPVLNIDVFAPARADYLHLVGYQQFFANSR